MTGPNAEVIAGFACENAPVILPKCKNPEAIYSLKKKRCECKVNGSDIKEREPTKFKNLDYASVCIACSWNNNKSTTVFVLDESGSFAGNWGELTAFVKKMFHYVRDSYVGVVQFSGVPRITLPTGLYSEKQLQATTLGRYARFYVDDAVAALIEADNLLKKAPSGNTKTVVLLTDGYVLCRRGWQTCQSITAKWRKENTQLVFVQIGSTRNSFASMFGIQKPHITRPAGNVNALTEMFFASLMQDMTSFGERMNAFINIYLTKTKSLPYSEQARRFVSFDHLPMNFLLKLAMLFHNGPFGWWSDFGQICQKCGVDLYKPELCSSTETCVKGTVFPTNPWNYAGTQSCVAKLYCPGSPTVIVKYATGKTEQVSLVTFNSNYKLECFKDGTRSMTGPDSSAIAGFVCENITDTTPASTTTATVKPKPVIKMQKRSGKIASTKKPANSTTTTTTTTKKPTTKQTTTTTTTKKPVILPKCKNPEAIYSLKKKRCECKVNGSDIKEREPEKFKNLAYASVCIGCSWNRKGSTTVFVLDESQSIRPHQWRAMAAFVKRMFHYVRDSYVSVVQFSSYSRVTLPMRLYTNEQLQATPLVQRTGYTNIIAALIDADQQLQLAPRNNTKTVILLTDGSGRCNQGRLSCKSLADKWRKENTQLVFVPIGFSGKSLAATFGSQKPHITRPAVNFNALTEMFFATLMQHMCVASTRK
ncbi:hypothetical protein Q1695_003976 [Nippostrongylus brasiliensis]|nr:hypothetical protein Q1695_003976 [Nippostrongylus brasiliensis]